jgi:hypothetical protein
MEYTRKDIILLVVTTMAVAVFLYYVAFGPADCETALERAKAAEPRALNDCDNGQSHLGSEVRGEQCDKCSGGENTDSGDESGHLNVPSFRRRKAEPGLFQCCFASRQNDFVHERVRGGTPLPWAS